MDVMILGSNELERIPYASGQTPSHEIWFNLSFQPYSSSGTKNTNILALFWSYPLVDFINTLENKHFKEGFG